MSAAPVLSGVGRAAAGELLATAGAAVRAALGDAGTPVSEVGGLLVCGPDAAAVGDLLAFELSWRTEVSDHRAVGAAVVAAVDAVASGRVGSLVCIETAPPPGPLSRTELFGPAHPVTGWASWHAPYGADDSVVDVALEARAYIERHGLTRSELARVALVASANAGGGLHLRDYLAAPMLADPLCVHDRARPVGGGGEVGGAAAIVLETARRAARRPKPTPVAVTAVGAAYSASPLAEQEPGSAIVRAADALRADPGATATRFDVLLVDDEYSFEVLTWLEALGCCEIGGAGRLVAMGTTIARTGPLPINPHGGHLGLGRRADLDLVAEAVAQLRGEGGRAQVGGRPRTAVVGLGGASTAGCLLLTA